MPAEEMGIIKAMHGGDALSEFVRMLWINDESKACYVSKQLQRKRRHTCFRPLVKNKLSANQRNQNDQIALIP
ncbi:hypothetical protein [Prochlorococcus sp. MIT 1300]|uniref:hypothetical protein n=1 Tax=Prochlorococcus sp. MIT 1300 TaxID=3096218 RepID=UPI002A74C7C5|nr:hypothetical protein [Prochlorococcus sp. MIT 1300]